ncbi:MAG: hypothetical protein IKU62_02045 [Ruminiclostridium sp.]|nr:hypothetical protein [Ruminiclostridium sp.]
MITELYAALEAVHAGEELSPVQVELPDGLAPEVLPLAQQVQACLTNGDSKALLDLCFSPVWTEYKAFLAPLSMTLCLTEPAIGLLNALDPQETPLTFLEDRFDDMGETIFLESDTRSLAFDRFGSQLMTVTHTESGTVTGWKKEFRYEGETQNGIPHGQGTQYAGTRRMLTGRLADTPHREGRWEKGVLVEGTYKDALVLSNEEGVSPVQGPDGAPLQMTTCVLDAFLPKNTPSCSLLHVTDLAVGPQGFEALGGLVPLCPARGGEFHTACQGCFLLPDLDLPQEDL